jgi:hypothetical protein
MCAIESSNRNIETRSTASLGFSELSTPKETNFLKFCFGIDDDDDDDDEAFIFTLQRR